MTSEVQVFNYEESKFDVIMMENEPWFIGKQVAGILGYSNTSDAISKHVDEDDKQLIDRSMLTNGVTDTIVNRDPSNKAISGINTSITIINESGLYSLILSSKLEGAKKFKKWVTSEVLPSIRKTGLYTSSSQLQINMPLQDEYNKALLSAGQSAQILNKMFKVPEGIAMAHSLNRVERDYGIDFQDIKKLLPSIETEEVETLTPTDIAKELVNHYNTKYSARQVNIILNDMELQVKIANGWELTEFGKSYGALYPYERNNHTGYQLRWNKTIIPKIISYLDTIN